MAHTSTTIYINRSSTPNQGVSVFDVNAVLKRNATDVGQLCSDQEWYDNNGTPALRRVYKINANAKYKPIRSSQRKVLTEADRQDAYYGLDITPSKGGASALASFIARYDSEWEYLPPRGEDNDEWHRLRDFDGGSGTHGYNHNANSFINANDLTLPQSTVVGQSVTFRIGLNTGNNLVADSISIDDLKLGGHEGTVFSELYGGLLFKSGNTYQLLTSPYKLGESNQSYVYTHGTEITFPAPQSTASYMVYPVLSANKYLTLSSTSSTDSIVSLPLASFPFTVVSETAVENLAITGQSARIGSGRYTVSFYVSLGGTEYDSINGYICYIREASDTNDRSGTLKKTIESSSALVKGTPQKVGPETIMGTTPNYVYIKVVDSARPAVYAEAWTKPKEVSPDPPTPIE